MRASAVYDNFTTTGTALFLDVILDGWNYASATITDLTTKHSDQVVKNNYAKTHLELKNVEMESIPEVVENYDAVIALSKEVQQKAVALPQMREREYFYGDLIMLAGEFKAKLEMLERVTVSLYNKQLELGAEFLKSEAGVKTLAIATKCIDTEWAIIQGMRRKIEEELDKDANVNVKEFLVELKGETADGEEVIAMVDLNMATLTVNENGEWVLEAEMGEDDG